MFGSRLPMAPLGAGGLSPAQRAALTSLSRASVAAAGEVLSVLVQRPVRLGPAELAMARWEPGETEAARPMLVVQVEYVSGVRGLNWLVLEASGARAIAALMTGQNPGEDGTLDEFHRSALAEAMNQMMGASATALSGLLDRPIAISPPTVEARPVRLGPVPPGDRGGATEGQAVVVSFPLRLGEESRTLIESRVLQIFPEALARQLADEYLDRHLPAGLPSEESRPPQAVGAEEVGDEDLDAWRHLGLTVTVRLGEATLSLAEALDLSRGAVVPLDRTEGEPADVLVSGTLVARGEVVVVRDRLGIRITEIVHPRSIDARDGSTDR